MSDFDNLENEINPPESPLAVPVFSMTQEFLELLDREFYIKLREWVNARVPKVLFGQDFHKRKVFIFFQEPELFVEFCKEFPELLRGKEDDF